MQGNEKIWIIGKLFPSPDVPPGGPALRFMVQTIQRQNACTDIPGNADLLPGVDSERFDPVLLTEGSLLRPDQD